MVTKKTTTKQKVEKKPDFDDLNEAAQTNENLIAKAADLTDDQLKSALEANDPTGSHAAYREND